MFGRRSNPEPRGTGGRPHEGKHRRDSSRDPKVDGWHVGTRGDGGLIEDLSADEQNRWDPPRSGG